MVKVYDYRAAARSIRDETLPCSNQRIALGLHSNVLSACARQLGEIYVLSKDGNIVETYDKATLDYKLKEATISHGNGRKTVLIAEEKRHRISLMSLDGASPEIRSLVLEPKVCFPRSCVTMGNDLLVASVHVKQLGIAHYSVHP